MVELRSKELEDKKISKMMDKARVKVESKSKNTLNTSIRLNRSINLTKTNQIFMSNNSMSSKNRKIKLDRTIHI